ncbi:MAG TPA: alpha/beta fold hydrolase, partial [Polyangiales bacterium]|nr:alpha/beta fold hydrolase [Polyangiales bacterium]
MTFDGRALHVEVAGDPPAVYDGTFSADPPSFAGTLSLAGASFPLELVPSEIVRPARPQEPKPPFPYDVEEVSYDNAAAGVHLAGTLTTPRGRRQHAAALLINGSGAQDRDSTISGHKPFLVIADYLTRRGIAVLRVDDRGVGGSTGDFAAATSADFTGDALAGVAYLKTRPDIDPASIGLIGHSEGGIIAPAAAARSNDVAFIVLLAGPGVPGRELIVRQNELLQATSNAPEGYGAFMTEVSRDLVDISVAEPDDVLAQQLLAARWNERKAEAASSQLSAEAKALIASPDTDAAISSSIKELRKPWMKYFLAYDPAPALTQVTCPVLALNGTLDLQVEAEQNLPAIAAALEAGQNPDYSI